MLEYIYAIRAIVKGKGVQQSHFDTEILGPKLELPPST